MTTLLNQALTLTLIGMGMTFAAIGLLVLGMYVMTALIKDTPPKARKAVVIEVEKNPQSEALAREVTAAVFPGVTLNPQAGPGPGFRKSDVQRDEDRYRAAAAAVAIAFAMQTTVTRQTNVAAADGWSAFVRGKRLAQRRYHRPGLRSQ